MKDVSTWVKLRSLDRFTYTEVGIQLGYALFGGLMPLIFSWFYKELKTGVAPPIADFAKAGEFALYAAALLAPAAYLLGQDRGKTSFPARGLWLLLCLVLISLSVASYMAVVPQVVDGQPFQLADVKFYTHATLWMFGLSAAFFCIVSILDATRASRGIDEIEDQQLNDLTRRTNALPE